MGRDPATQEQIRQDQQHDVRADPSSHHRGQLLAVVLVENVENPKGPTILSPIRDEVIRPDMMAVRGPQPEARPIGAPESSALRLFRWHFEAFVSPNCVHAIFAHVPALASQEIRHGSVARPPVLLGQGDDPLAQPLLTRVLLGPVPIGGPDLADRLTRPAFRNVEHRHSMPHRFAPAGRAQKFPAATSFRIERSSAWSATIRLRRRFSCSSPFSRLA